MIRYYKYSITDFTNAYYKVIENSIAVESIKRSNIRGKIYYTHDYNKLFCHEPSVTMSARNWYKMIRKINIKKNEI